MYDIQTIFKLHSPLFIQYNPKWIVSQFAMFPASGQWEAFLVEANPQFTKELNALQENFPGQARHRWKITIFDG